MAGQCRDAGVPLEVGEISNKNNTLRSLANKVFAAAKASSVQSCEDKAPTRTVSASAFQSLYLNWGLYQSLNLDVSDDLTKTDVTKHLEGLAERHEVLQSSFKSQADGVWLMEATARGFAHDDVPLEPFISDEQCTSRVRDIQEELAKSRGKNRRVLKVMLFGEAARVRKVALLAPAAALDAHSWHVITRDLTSSLRHQPTPHQTRLSFIDWLDDQGQSRILEVAGSDEDISRRQAQVEDAIKRALPPSSYQDPGFMPPTSGTITLPRDVARLLTSDVCHQALRTEVHDVILASAATVFQESQRIGEAQLFEVRNGRPSKAEDKQSWDSVLGCFDVVSALAHHSFERRDAFDAARRAKDARRQRSALASRFKDLSDCQQKVLFDFTEVEDSQRPAGVPNNTRRSVGQVMLNFLADIYVLPSWTSQGGLNIAVAVKGDLMSEDELAILLQDLQRRLCDMVAELTAGGEDHTTLRPTLDDFPHIVFDYPSLDHTFADKLRKVVTDPLASIEKATPCSPVQDNILQATAQDAAAYICTFKVRLSASKTSVPCGAAACSMAWKDVVAKHAALRTVFVESIERPGHFDQFVLKSVQPRIDILSSTLDPSSVSPQQIVFQPLEVPHHLMIVQENPSQCLLVLTISHAIVDGHSAEVLFSDICSNLSGGHSDNGNTDPVLQFPDYILNRHPSRSHHPSAPFTKSMYWTEYLQKVQETQLPVTWDSNGLSGFETISSHIPVNIKSVDRLCQQNEVNLASLCQLAWGVVLRTHIGSDNVCFSTIAATRHVPLKGIMTAVGPLIATLLCSVNLQSDDKVLHALKNVHSDHQDSLFHEAEITSAVSTRRWTNTVMSFRRRLVQNDESLSAVSCQVVQGRSPTNYDVSLIVSAGQADLEVNMDYWSSRIDRTYARTLLQSFEKALRSILENLHATISDLELISAEHEERLLERNGAVPNGLRQCVHELIESRVHMLDSSSTAVNAWDGTLTYGELRQKACSLSRRLISMGAGPEIPIGLCMGKSMVVPVAMLAILISGSAVLPIGVQEPIARVEAIVADSSPALILCDEQQQRRLGGLDFALLDVPNALSEPDQPLIPSDISRGNAENTCWIFYTSGSTGRPKGVLIEHGAMATSLRAHGDAIGWSEETRIFQFSAHTFDASVLEICTTLVYGGCVCIPSDSDRLNDLEGSILRLQVNTLALTSSAAALIRPQAVPLVKKLMLFGEAVKKTVVDSWYGQADVYNSYGPTETSILVSAGKPIRALDDFSNIGQPLNVNLWVADVSNPGKLVPLGAPGELLVEGPLLARGYLNDKAKTEAAFIMDPEFSCRMFGAGAGRRFYRTGDVVRQNDDLSMSYVGRRDKQVKVRGQRLEVAEVEHWIVKTLRIAKRAVVGLLPVTLLEDGADLSSRRSGDVLCAAIELFPGEAGYGLCNTASGFGNILAPSEGICNALGNLRDNLQEKLPSYMVPTFYVPFRHIPLTANSKTDWKDVLATLKDLRREDFQKYIGDNFESNEGTADDKDVASRTVQQLSTLWADVLGRPDVSFGVRHHFLHQGGDSVLAIRLVEAARRKGVLKQMTVADVMSWPRLGELAQMLDERAGREASERHDQQHDETPTVPYLPLSLWRPLSSGSRENELADIARQCSLDVDDIEDVYPCSPLQQAMFAATQQRSTAYTFQQTYNLSPSVDIDRLVKAWELLVMNVPVMRTRILLGHRTGVALQVLSKRGLIWTQSDNLLQYTQDDRNSPISNGHPLMRFALVRDSGSDSVHFVWTAHHSTYDGWSLQLMFRELAGLYLNDDRSVVVPFVGFIQHLQKARVHSEDAASFWANQLRGDSTYFPSLPSSNYQPMPQDVLYLDLKLPDVGITAGVKELPLATILRAAWAMTLSQYLSATQVTFGATLSGRSAHVPDITELIAPTLTTVPVQIEVNSGQRLGEYLAKVQSQATEMIPFEQTGLEDIKRLVSDVQPHLTLPHVLVIQPSSMSGGAETKIPIPGVHLKKTAVDAFDTFALSVQCDLPDRQDAGTPVKVEARFDRHVLEESQVHVLLRQFQHWTCKFLDQSLWSHTILDLESMAVGDLVKIRETNAKPPVLKEQYVHRLVQAMAMQQQGGTAICAWDGDFTYGELCWNSRNLAQQLVSIGVGPDVRIGVCMDKSKWQWLSALGVPLVVPNDIVAASNAQETLQMSQVCPQLKPTHPAWIVYSSGSTGTPKGSLHLHSGLATSLVAHGKATGWSQDSRVFQFAAHTFDAALQEILTTLIFGGCVCIPSETQRMDALTRTIKEFAVTHLVLTFSVAGIVNPSEVPSVQQLLVVGEQAKPGVIERWLGHAEILNMYGPSECAICVSRSAPIQRVEDGPNIGWPLNGCNFWVVSTSDHTQLCPIGVPGELLIEAAWSAREYIKKPELTAKSFLTEPRFLEKIGLEGAGRRMYRSGDLVRQNANGSYVHLGRIGSELKYRGQKIQLGEIEYWVSRLMPEAKAVIVDLIDYDTGEGTSDLVAVLEVDVEGDAFVQPAEHQTEQWGDLTVLTPSPELQRVLYGLRDALAEKLPSHSVPTAFLPLWKIPLTPSGKADGSAIRRAISSSESASSLMKRYLAVGSSKEAPGTETGMKLRELWAGVLSVGIDSIGAQDHFSRLGGDSLAAMNLASIAQQAGLQLTVAMILNNPILANLIQVLEQAQKAAGGSSHHRPDTLPFELLFNAPSTSWKTSIGSAVSDTADLQGWVAEVAAQCSSPIDQIQDVYPCTGMQEALFAVTARQPSTYTFRQIFKATRDVLDIPRFQKAWDTVAQTLPILRTRIVLGRNGQLYQAVVNAPLQWHNGSELGPYINDDKGRAFELGQPLLRCAIIQPVASNCEDKCHFVLTAHHSMFDRFSLERVFYEYVLPTYAGSPMPDVVPYTRFIRYVLEMDIDKAAHYWQQQVGDNEGFVDFPPRHPEIQDEPSHCKSTSSITMTITAGEMQGHGTSLANLLRAAWALTVSQYAASDDVMFAVNLSGRSAPVAGITQITGPTFTTVPVRVKIDQTQTVKDFLRMVQEDAVAMIPYEHIGLQNIQELVPGFTPARFKHLFLVHPAVRLNMAAHLAGLEQVDSESQSPLDYDLELMCKIDERGNNKIVVEARFDGNALQHDQMNMIMRQFRHNVTQLSGADANESATQTIGNLPMINSQDQEQLMAWNENANIATIDDLRCVHEPFRKLARQYPDVIAIDSWDGQLTYGELDQLATMLANMLVSERSVRPEVTVGLAMAKSRWAIVAMLATLYAGGAVVPLGIQLPDDKIRSIIDDCGPSTILCDEDQARRLDGLGLGTTLVKLNQAVFTQIQQRNGVDVQQSPADLVRSHNMAWVMYTSGSTGVPKGVVLEHRSVACSILGHTNVCNLGPSIRAFQFSAYSFDVSISDIFATLGKGGTVCVPSEDERLNDLVGAIQRLRATSLHVTASTAALIHPEDVPEVQTLVLGGEKIPPALIEKWLRLSNATLVNSYGPVECSIASTANAPIQRTTDSAVIGTALPGTNIKTWVADPKDASRLVPIGAVGELLVEGPNLAREYLNDPSKTASSFIDGRGFFTHANEEALERRRMYRTGDLVQYQSSGSILLIGRNDSQVKIRGQRVDLGEIEHTILVISPAVKCAVVDYILYDQDQAMLIAALELNTGSASDLGALSETLKSRLPNKVPTYMVPQHYMLLDAMPKTTSGKLDRRAVCKDMLRSRKRDQHSSPDVIGKPPGHIRGDKESLVRDLWAKVLKLDTSCIDREDSFLDLGADSIGAMKLVAMAKLEGLEMKVFDIFKNPILRALADVSQVVTKSPDRLGRRMTYRPFQLLKNIDNASTFLEQVVCPVTLTSPEEIEDVFPTTDAVSLCVVGALTSSQVEIHTFTLDFKSDVDLIRLQASCSLLSRHVEALRTVFAVDSVSGNVLQVVLKSFQHSVGIVKVQECLETATRDHLSGAMSRPFVLGAPMVRMAIIRRDETNQTRLLIRLSHSLYDGLSLPLFYQTFKQLYDHGAEADHHLTSYAAHVQELALQDNSKAYEFWRRVLRGSTMTQLSSARKANDPYPSQMEFAGRKTVTCRRAWGEGITTSTIVAVAWAHVLAQYTGDDDVVFGDSISGTNLVDPSVAESVVGCRATHVPVRVRFYQGCEQTLLMILHQFRDQARDRIPHEALGFRTIIHECTDWARSTRFTSIVNHRPGQATRVPPVNGLDFSTRVINAYEGLLTSWYDVAVLTEDVADGVEIALGHSTDAISSETAARLFADLVDTVELIMEASVDWSRQSTLLGSELMPNSSLASKRAMQPGDGCVNGSKTLGGSQGCGTLEMTPDPLLVAICSSGQTSPSKSKLDGASRDAPQRLPFYQLGGDLLNALHLSTMVEQRRSKTKAHTSPAQSDVRSSHSITVDDVLQNPSLMEFDRFLKDYSIALV
ncbi:AMP-binding enzyme domain-containing protein [Sarocladium implicatum]|nr:AMP-binding enzyme domain-containing protein [Sarocladium implicatum]